MPDIPHNEEEPVRLPRPGETLCGLKRTMIFELCQRGLVRSKRVCVPGAKRVALLIYKSSLLAYISNSEEGGAPRQ